MLINIYLKYSYIYFRGPHFLDTLTLPLRGSLPLPLRGRGYILPADYSDALLEPDGFRWNRFAIPSES